MKPNFEKHKSDGLLINSVIGYEGEDIPEGYESIDSMFPIETETYILNDVFADKDITVILTRWGQLIHMKVIVPMTANEEKHALQINLRTQGVDPKFIPSTDIPFISNIDGVAIGYESTHNNIIGVTIGTSVTEDTNWNFGGMGLKID